MDSQVCLEFGSLRTMVGKKAVGLLTAVGVMHAGAECRAWISPAAWIIMSVQSLRFKDAMFLRAAFYQGESPTVAAFPGPSAPSDAVKCQIPAGSGAPCSKTQLSIATAKRSHFFCEPWGPDVTRVIFFKDVIVLTVTSSKWKGLTLNSHLESKCFISTVTGAQGAGECLPCSLLSDAPCYLQLCYLISRMSPGCPVLGKPQCPKAVCLLTSNRCHVGIAGAESVWWRPTTAQVS